MAFAWKIVVFFVVYHLTTASSYLLQFSGEHHMQAPVRNRRQIQFASYDEEFTRTTPIREDASSNTVLFDFRTVTINRMPASSFAFTVINAVESVPQVDDLFVVEDRQLRFGTTFSSTRRKKYFDYEQFPTVVVIIEAVQDNDPNGLDKKVIKLSIPLSDVNDEFPVIRNQPYPYLAAIPVEADSDHTVYVLFAEDPDGNSDVEYEIGDSADQKVRDYFRMEQVVENAGRADKLVEGHIKIARRFTFTAGATFQIPVVVRDRAAVGQVVSATVDVLVGPRPPQFFKEKYEGWIFETENSNNPVYMLSDDDGDQNEELTIQVHQFQENYPKTFRILDDNNKESTQFRIDENGRIYNKASLDFDVQVTQRPPKSRLIIKVTETSQNGDLEKTVPLEITIRDENDNAPRFQLTQYLKPVPENMPIGETVLTVLAEDNDSDRNAEVTYELDNPYFQIKKVGKSGVITLKDKLDFDAPPGPTYRFIVYAKDGGVPSLSSSVDVTVTTTNVNDEHPTIISPGLLVMRDIVPDKFILTRLRATDADGDNVRFYFSPLSEKYRIFNIKPSSGIIEVIADVPKNIDSYVLNITAEDDGSCCGSRTKLRSETSFSVEIVDSVNQKPAFTSCLNYSSIASFEEESLPGHPVIKVSATDPDRGLNGIVTYKIESPSPNLHDAPFDMNPDTGEIFIKSTVNREALVRDFIQVTVKGSDRAQTPQEGWCTFRVNVKDINDNAPVFNSPSYSEKISSNSRKGRVFLRVGATDADIGDNAKITYSLDDDAGGLFGIYGENGLIFLKDQPASGTYNLKVRAQDHGSIPKFGTVIVTIEVSTETKDPPKFDPDVTSPSYTYSIAETVIPNSQEAVITRLGCQSNIDNPTVQYFLVDSRGVLQSQEAGAFGIEYSADDNMVEVRVAQPLDYEKVRQYSIILRCQNLAQLTMYDQITLTVDVTDRNNKVPYFEGMDKNGRYVGSVPENTAAGSLVIEVQGYDDDVTESFNQLEFRFLEESDDFELRNLPGNKAAIITKREFDRERKPSYIVTVIADDQSPSDRVNHKPPGSSNTASVVVLVTISDKNDNKMVFAQSQYNHTVKETESIGHVIFSVTADDIDEVDQGRLKYSFTNSEEIPFDIRDQTGEIVVTGKLDYESTIKSYLLKLESRDSQDFYKANTLVKIDVLDENDNPPVFSKSEYVIDSKVVEEDFSVSKSNPMELIMVTATDADTSRSSNMRYQLLGGEGTEPGDRQLFTIDQRTGQVYLVAALDRDEPNGKSEYVFTVEALDEDLDPQKGYTNIKVKPLDINDNRPIFDVDRLTGEVFEHSEPGWFCDNRDNCLPIAVVITNDFDFEENATVDYEIVSSPTTSSLNYFNIDNSGRIFSQVEAINLDREQRTKLEVVVRAKDQGPDPQTSTATVTIILKDINDNAPVFSQKIYNVVMSERLSDGIVTEVHATDNDEDENAALQFSLSEQDAVNRHFKVETIENRGAITIYDPVDYESLDDPVFELEIIVRDNNPDHVDTATVIITVEDFNDNAPLFKDEFISVNIEENQIPGENVSQFQATDADSGINAEFTYLIDRDSDRRREFLINPITGVVKTRKKLDREVEAKMNIIIKAVDKGDPKQTGTATLEVTVVDTNDNYPIFKEDYRPVIQENMVEGVNNVSFPLKVQDILAIDKDTAIYGPPFGFALPPDCNILACRKFSLVFDKNADGGYGTANISTSSVFDREEYKFYELPIVMWDLRGLGSPKAQTGTNTLTIVIGDVNDEPHFPGHQDIFVYNYKGQFGPIIIGRVYAEDLDDWDLPDKTFTFESPSSMKNFFSVDKDTGDITMKKGVRSNFGREPYTFRVTVVDAVHKKSVTSTVSVVVKDLTEEAVLKSGAVRLAGMTGEKFILEPKDPRTGRRLDSLYTQFRLLMAQKLGYNNVDNVEIVTLRDGDGYLEVRYAAHGSPYLSSAQVDSAVILNKNEFESLGLAVMAIPIDECEDEIFEGGCYNHLEVTGNPVMINANGTSYVGVEAYLVATEGCETETFPNSNDCTGDYCLNGGTCKKDYGGTLSCDCMHGFDGPRCQQRRHHFDGNSVAFYKTLQQCEDSQTSIEFITAQENGILLYNGPLVNIDPLESPQDFIYLELRGGYPVLMIDHGTGVLNLTLDGKDNHGNQLMQKLNDGRWHQIDINRKGKMVDMVVDKCTAADSEFQFVEDDRACRVAGETPGENIFINVNTQLHLGGVQTSETLLHLGGRNIVGFNGCIKNLIHNKQLYDLHFKAVPGIKTGSNGCPTEDNFCGLSTSSGPVVSTPVCGVNGVCEATLDGVFTCTCKPGWFGETCEKPANIREFDKNSYFLWQMKLDLFNSARMTRNRELSVQLMFRTRQTSGILIDLYDSSSTESTLHIRLLLNEGKIRLTYNLGDGEKNLDLPHAQANNGQWHVVSMERFGTEFHLRMDGGEGKNYNYRLKSYNPKERDVFKVNRRVYSGAFKQGIGLSSVLTDDLVDTCIQDVRVNNGYFALTEAESDDPDTMARVEENINTKEGCIRNDCLADTCKVNMVCIPLWEDHECRCHPGYRKEGEDCLSSCEPNPCFNNVTCNIVKSVVLCVCPPGWRGQFCDELAPEGVKSSDLGGGVLAAIIVSIILVLLLAILIFLLYKFCPRNDDGEKYILEVDPEDDIRENVMNYDEEGAGEEDQDAYDLSRLQRPNYESSNRPMDMEKRKEMPRLNAQPDQPDVGNFIDDRMKDADNDNGAPPYDSVREFNFEGGDSEAGSLSSLNTSSSDRSHDYNYLEDWGPKFAKLADMYGAGQDLDD